MPSKSIEAIIRRCLVNVQALDPLTQPDPAYDAVVAAIMLACALADPGDYHPAALATARLWDALNVIPELGKRVPPELELAGLRLDYLLALTSLEHRKAQLEAAHGHIAALEKHVLELASPAGTAVAQRPELATSPNQASAEPVLIWSNKHMAWWKAESNGYTKVRAEAGVYTRADAETRTRKNYHGRIVGLLDTFTQPSADGADRRGGHLVD